MGSGRKRLAALVLCEDHLVRAYATVDEARASRPRILLEQPFEVKESGAKAAPQDDCYALLREPVAVPTLPAVSSSLQGSLLRTNVQKAVRRQDAAAAADLSLLRPLRWFQPSVCDPLLLSLLLDLVSC